MNTIPVEQVFLGDILAHPEDIALRLIYADWLEDHDAIGIDTIRAATIRAECAAGELHGGPMTYHGRLIWIE